jgi:hypothetical protein
MIRESPNSRIREHGPQVPFAMVFWLQEPLSDLFVLHFLISTGIESNSRVGDFDPGRRQFGWRIGFRGRGCSGQWPRHSIGFRGRGCSGQRHRHSFGFRARGCSGQGCRGCHAQLWLILQLLISDGRIGPDWGDSVCACIGPNALLDPEVF